MKAVSFAPALDRLRRVRTSRSLLVAGVGMGLTSRAVAAGGADVIVAYHSAPLRLQGLPSVSGILPLTDANQDTLELLPQITGTSGAIPVGATVFASDPRLDLGAHLQRVHTLGASAVMNAPPITLLADALANDLEKAHLGFSREVDLAQQARATGLATIMYVFTDAQAATFAENGADILVIHLGITGASPPADKRTADADKAPTVPPNMRDDAKISSITKALENHPDIILLVHGGHIASPADVRNIQASHPRIDGFFGVSSIERIPIYNATYDVAASYTYTR